MAVVGTGFESGQRCAARAAAAAAAELESGEADLVLAHWTEEHDAQVVWAALGEVFGDAPLVGCQAPAIIADGAIHREGVGVLALRGLECARTALVPIGPDGKTAPAAAAACRAVLDGSLLPRERSALLLFPDAIAGNSCDAVRGADAAVGSSLRVVGGGSGDDLRFERAAQLGGEGSAEAAVSAALLVARSPLGQALRHGSRPVGLPVRATRIEGRVLHELDWRPAQERYAEIASELGCPGVDGERFLPFAMEHPFGIPHGQDYVLRSPVASLGEGGILCCADLPRDAVLRVMETGTGALLEATRRAAAAARETLSEAPAVALVYACVSREFVLQDAGSARSREVAAVLEGVRDRLPVFGALTFGQIGALPDAPLAFHSKSVQVLAVPLAAA